jgi:hypothetical protein
LLVDANPYSYSLYGLHLASNWPLTNILPSVSVSSPAELVVNFACLPQIDSSARLGSLIYTSAAISATGQPTLRVWELPRRAFLRLAYSDGTEFWIDRSLETVWVIWPDCSSLDDTLCYFLGPISGLLLRLRGRVCLHASAVEVNGACIVFVGCEGAGKSTIAAAFARLGSPVLSDDIVALVEQEGRFHCNPAYPRINLWPSSVKLLYGSEDALPLIAAGWEKRFLGLGQEGMPKFSERALPVRAIYVFGNPANAGEQCVESLSKKDALLTLVANTYAANFLDAKQRGEEFELLSRLVAEVPIRKVNARHGLISIYALCELIYQDFTHIDSLDARS